MIESSLTLQCGFLEPLDYDRGIVRLDPSDLKRLGLSVGARVMLNGGGTVHALAYPATMEHRNQGLVLLDDVQLHNCGARAGDVLKISAAPELDTAPSLALTAQHGLDARAAKARLPLIRRQLEGQAVSSGHVLRVRMADQFDMMLQVTAIGKNTPGIVRNLTDIQVAASQSSPRSLAMSLLGGMRREFYWLEEWLGAMRQHPQSGMRCVLLEGPSGSGKTTLVDALAQHTGTYLDKIYAARVIAAHGGAGEIFEQSFSAAASQAPAIIMIDDIDLLLPATTDWTRSVMANQFYAQLDRLPRSLPVVIIGLTHQRHAIDPAALRPGRFERTLIIDPPDRENRLEILQILARDHQLAEDVSLERLAALTEHFVGSDLQAMVKNAALRAQRAERLKARATAGVPEPLPIAMHHFRAALTEIVPQRGEIYSTESPAINWSDIAGHEDIKQTLREAVERPINFGLLHDNKSAPPPHGVLITGAPGTGKTNMVRALANATRARFIHVDALDIALADDPPAILRRLFIKARQSAPSMLFIDSLDALVPQPDTLPDSKLDIAFNAFLREFDATQDMHGLTILAATSHADRIDHALLKPGRFDYVLNIPLPDTLARQKIFDYHAHKLPLAADVNADELAEATQGFSGADIEGVCRRAGILALRQSVAQQDGQLAPPVVNMAIFMQILRGWRR